MCKMKSAASGSGQRRNRAGGSQKSSSVVISWTNTKLSQQNGSCGLIGPDYYCNLSGHGGKMTSDLFNRG